MMVATWRREDTTIILELEEEMMEKEEDK